MLKNLLDDVEPIAPKSPRGEVLAMEVAEAPVFGAPVADQLDFVWESSPLTRTSLNIPDTEGTNATGSVYFTKGQTAGIEQRPYFRKKVFEALDWRHDNAAGKEHIERAKAKFRIIIKDVNCGVFEVPLTHDSRPDSPAYRQKNSLTHLQWNDVRPLVAHEYLLDRTMFLYRHHKQPRLFVLEID